MRWRSYLLKNKELQNLNHLSKENPACRILQLQSLLPYKLYNTPKNTKTELLSLTWSLQRMILLHNHMLSYYTNIHTGILYSILEGILIWITLHPSLVLKRDRGCLTFIPVRAFVVLYMMQNEFGIWCACDTHLWGADFWGSCLLWHIMNNSRRLMAFSRKYRIVGTFIRSRNELTKSSYLSGCLATSSVFQRKKGAYVCVPYLKLLYLP